MVTYLRKSFLIFLKGQMPLLFLLALRSLCGKPWTVVIVHLFVWLCTQCLPCYKSLASSLRMGFIMFIITPSCQIQWQAHCRCVINIYVKWTRNLSLYNIPPKTGRPMTLWCMSTWDLILAWQILRKSVLVKFYPAKLIISLNERYLIGICVLSIISISHNYFGLQKLFYCALLICQYI